VDAGTATRRRRLGLGPPMRLHCRWLFGSVFVFITFHSPFYTRLLVAL